MSGFDDWLAAMPVEDVRRRITELESELETLRVLERRHRAAVRQEKVTPSPKMPHTGGHMPKVTTTPRAAYRRRLSPERQAILAVIAQHPQGMSPVEVARALAKEPNPIQTNMSRMVAAGQLVRRGQGRYVLPEGVAPETDFDALLDTFQNVGTADEEVVQTP